MVKGCKLQVITPSISGDGSHFEGNMISILLVFGALEAEQQQQEALMT